MPYLKQTLFFLAGLLLCHVSAGQTVAVSTADSLFNSGHYKQACSAYFNDFKLYPQDTTDAGTLYNAAMACAKVKYNDSAYRYLFIMAADQQAIKYFDEVIYGMAFKNIRSDQRWNGLILAMEKYKHDYNPPVSAEFTETGKARLAVESAKDSVLNRGGRNFKLIRKYTDSIKTIDSINDLKFKTIINTYGWMGPRNLGKEGFRWLIYLYKKLPIGTQEAYFLLL